jgi:hypothetical protein
MDDGVKSVRVVNLEDLSQERYDTLPPRSAVIAAYAQAMRRDWNTWDYEARYSDVVRQTRNGWVCGPFWCLDPEVEAVHLDGSRQRPKIGQTIGGVTVARLVACRWASTCWEFKDTAGVHHYAMDSFEVDGDGNVIWELNVIWEPEESE